MLFLTPSRHWKSRSDVHHRICDKRKSNVERWDKRRQFNWQRNDEVWKRRVGRAFHSFLVICKRWLSERVKAISLVIGQFDIASNKRWWIAEMVLQRLALVVGLQLVTSWCLWGELCGGPGGRCGESTQIGLKFPIRLPLMSHYTVMEPTLQRTTRIWLIPIMVPEQRYTYMHIRWLLCCVTTCITLSFCSEQLRAFYMHVIMQLAHVYIGNLSKKSPIDTSHAPLYYILHWTVAQYLSARFLCKRSTIYQKKI